MYLLVLNYLIGLEGVQRDNFSYEQHDQCVNHL